jgi:CHAT domain-containing protein
VFVRSAASENALKGTDLRNVRVLHFATHALMDDRNMSRSMLVLSRAPGNDGFVGPEELSALNLRDALVVLSGCSTIGGVVLGGEGLRGLTAPLLEAGARAVVATHWAIGDRSVLPFIDRFYAHMAFGRNAATALQRAKLDAIGEGIPASVWAAFSIVGDGSMTVSLRPIQSAPIPWVRRSQGN